MPHDNGKKNSFLIIKQELVLFQSFLRLFQITSFAKCRWRKKRKKFRRQLFTSTVALSLPAYARKMYMCNFAQLLHLRRLTSKQKKVETTSLHVHHAFFYISWLRHEKFPRVSERERERESSLPLSLSSLPSFFFLREFLSCALLSKRLEQANLFKTFKASYFLLNSYIWCFLAEKSNLRVQKNNTLNLERKKSVISF